MNNHLQSILNFIEQDENLSADEKNAILKSLKDADKELEITTFKLDRTEKVKRTTAILLEETIEELEQKRKAVEAQNRELEIESSLERVRTVAMSMMKSDALMSVCEILLTELQLLGFKDTRLAQIFIFNDAKESCLNYQFSDYGVKGITEINYNSHPVIKKLTGEMRKAKEAFMKVELSGNELEEWKNWRKEVGQLTDPKLDEATSIFYYWYSIGAGAIGISTFKGIAEEQMKILDRFRNVFSLAYKRYTDIAQAEAQAREAKIEAALEKVRSRSLAMHKSDELWEVIAVVFEKLQELKFSIDGAAFITTFIEGTREQNAWVAGNDSQPYPTNLRLPYLDSPAINDIWQAKESGLDFFSKTYSFEEKNHWLKYAFEHTGLKSMTDEFKNWILEQPCMTQSIAIEKNSLIGIHFHHQKTLSDTEVDILKRFSKVFDQAYIRFLDLQKAEAQARESHIQLALERVRARTMAMQKSNELPDAANLLFQQMQALGMPAWSAGYCIWDADKQGITLWMSSEGVMQPSFHMPLTDDPSLIHMKEAHERQESFHVEAVGGEELISHYRYMRTLPGIGEILDSIINAGHPLPAFQIFHCAYFSQGFLLFITYEPVPEAHDIFKRFAKVFEQTYTRFLDLQKAEAQAREAKIEAALERVRSRTMGMQKSEELKEVIQVVYEQFVHLNIHVEHTGFIMDYKARDDMHIWLADKHEVPSEITIPYFDSPHWNSFIKAKEKGEDFFANYLTFEEKNKFYQDLFKLFPVPDEAKEYYFNCPGLAGSTVLLDNVGLYIENFSGIPYTDEENNTLMRFGKVFQQTYTRFLDLQKAEAQVREAKIEAALERTRTQSMLMQHSNELDNTLRVFHEQVLLLGIHSAFSFLWLPDEDKDRHIFWAAWAENVPIDPLTKKGATVFKSKAINYPLDRKEPATAQCLIDWKGKEPVVSYHVPPAGVESYFAAWQELIAGVEQLKPEYFSDGLYYVEAFMKYGCFGVMIKSEMPEEEKKILGRFAIEFERAYTRFLDLQKAEAQAREAKIEAALERVRSRTMAMQRSDELANVATVLFQQVKTLGVPQWTCGFSIFEIDDKEFTWYPGSADGSILLPVKIPLTEHPVFISFNESRKRGDELFVYEKEGELQAGHYRYMQSLPGVGEMLQKMLDVGLTFPTFQIDHVANFSHGNLVFITYEHFPEMHDIFKRFAKVFEQTYTRFLDLQKAEAQARESQIQLALERVRARTMAMQRSEELADAATVLFQQVKSLGISQWTCGFNIWEPGDKEFTFYPGSPDGDILPPCKNVPLTEDPVFILFDESRKRGDELCVYESKGEIQEAHYHYMLALPGGLGAFLQNLLDHGVQFPTFQIDHIANFSNGNLLFITYEHFPEMHDIFKRFAKVFEQTYTRFLDLQKAEAQARESKIEAALEKVRARTIGMQRSEELPDAASLLFKQLQALGVTQFGCSFNIWDDDRKASTCWGAREDALSPPFKTSSSEDIFVYILEAAQRGESLFVREQAGAELETHYRYMSSIPEVKAIVDEMSKAGVSFPTFQIIHCAFFSQGYLMFITYEPVPDAYDVFKRFAKVFEQTYTRFLDLQKAEALARESQIEASLERVRSKAMAMQKSEDLAAAVATVFEELDKLNLGMLRCGIGILNKLKCSADVWTTTKSEHGTIVHLAGNEPMNIHPLFQGAFDAWLHQRENFSYVLQGEDMGRFYKAVADSDFQLPESQSIIAATNELKQYYFVATFQSGGLYAFRETPFPEEAKTVMKRFADVFNFTYTRFNDLKQAEAQTREAIKASSLDRVRAEIASMRTTDDLQRITPSIWKELTVLGVPFFRCGVFIINEKEKKAHVYLSTPDGKPLAVLRLDFDSSDTTRNSIENWRIQKVYTEHWDREQFISWAKSLIGQGQIKAQETYQGGDLPPESLTLQFVPFAQGMLYVGSIEPLSELQVELVHSLAKAFSTAYARYEDFNKLEFAKEQIEKTLVDLKQAQTQLIQSEKMASLGELTAGIAHEIQNPLNFVNNFSEVNKELLEEMKDEIDKGNIAEVKSIADDVIQNEEKINHHGKRADAIVKGMLQHSRSSSAVKEPTDINKLADEYLRLSYHGLRAKDKTFNATIKTDFDETIGNINIIPQDIGRAILNLITNAFYVVGEKKKQKPEGYEPTVSVSTKKVTDKVLVSVKDNGNGIPQKVVEKIFQPFFTTKPTGQGTGLGLSLSYDIVKAHRGEIQVATKEGEGTEFIIQIPIV